MKKILDIFKKKKKELNGEEEKNVNTLQEDR